MLIKCLASIALMVLASGAQTQDFAWDMVEPTKDLRYHDCYNGYKCARLKVPLDWNDPQNNDSVAIAILTVPATVSEDDPSFGGTVITNPGGPGASGVDAALHTGKYIQWVIDKNKHYEILSFDPRGVAHTTPRADCFGGKPIKDAYRMQDRGSGPLVAEGDPLKHRFAIAQAFWSLCEETDRNVNILPHVGTAAVARDMVEIAERVDELRRKTDLPRSALPTGDIVRVQFFGLSYDARLGNVFASMFPGRVGRVAADAIIYNKDFTTVRLPSQPLLPEFSPVHR